MARKPPKGKSLAELKPELAKQWHKSKNGDLTPFDVSCGSDKRVWWKCPKGDDHVWDSVISTRYYGSNCPMCSGRRATYQTSLAVKSPEIAKMWHPTKNENLTTYDVTPNSGKKVWWLCSNNHVFNESIHNVQRRKIKCIICNSLAVVNPDLAKEWHPTKNGHTTAYDVSFRSAKKVWWKCDQGDDHEWQASPDNRRKNGCSVCAGLTVVTSNCLATKHPELAKEWHPNKNGGLTPFNILAGSHKNIWWKCPEGDDHEWSARLSSRLDGNGCSVCNGKKVVTSNCLATTDPELAKEWHPTKNGNLSPFDFVRGSRKRVWWQCSIDDKHQWYAGIANRTTGETGCPSCAEYGFNPLKQAFFYIRKITTNNSKFALKFGITNQLDGGRERKQKRGFVGEMITIFKIEIQGIIALEIENRCKKIFGKSGYLSKDELPDGFTETIKYSEENFNNLKLVVDRVLNDKKR